MKTKTLIVLYSYHHGNTEKIAHVFLLDLAYELSPVTGRIDKELYDNHLPLREMLTSKGYSVVDEFFCLGYNTFSFLRLFGGINWGRPDDRDFAKAEEFARRLKRSLTESKVPLDRSV